MLARRYMHEYGGRARAPGRGRDGRARPRQPQPRCVDVRQADDDGRLHGAPAGISEPLCLFDNCLETDGALAAVLVSAERARDCPHPPALVHAFAQGLHRQHESMVNYYCDDPLDGPGLGVRGEAVGPVRHRTRRHRRGADLRRVHPARPAVPRGLRVLQDAARRRTSSPTGTCAGTGVACRSTRRAAGCRRRTSTGSTSSPKASASFAGPRPARSPARRTCLVTSGEGVPTSALVLRAA